MKKPTPEPAPDNAEAPDQSPGMQRFDEWAEDMLAQPELDVTKLSGSLRDVMLELFRHRPKAWSEMVESEQRDCARLIQNAVDGFLSEAVLLIAAEGRPNIEARLEKFTGKGGKYQASLIAVGGPEMAAQLARLDGHEVLIISADAASFQRGEPAKVQPDQAALEMDEEEPGAELEEGADPETGEVPRESSEDETASAAQGD